MCTRFLKPLPYAGTQPFRHLASSAPSIASYARARPPHAVPLGWDGCRDALGQSQAAKPRARPNSSDSVVCRAPEREKRSATRCTKGSVQKLGRFEPLTRLCPPYGPISRPWTSCPMSLRCCGLRLSLPAHGRENVRKATCAPVPVWKRKSTRATDLWLCEQRTAP